MKKILAIAVFLTAVAVGATAEIAFDRYAVFKPALFVKGIYLGRDVGTNRAQQDIKNKLTGSFGCSATWDFPAIGGNNQLGVQCAETDPVTCTGVRIGDPCMAGVDLGSDGGSLLVATAQLNCQVSAANRVTGKLCVHLTDGGTFDLGDAGYNFRVFSNQPQP